MHEKSIELLNKGAADELAAVHQYMYFHFHCDDQIGVNCSNYNNTGPTLDDDAIPFGLSCADKILQFIEVELSPPRNPPPHKNIN